MDYCKKYKKEDFKENSHQKNSNSKKSKIFKKKQEDGTLIYEVDKARLKQLNTLTQWELPELTVHVLSKLTINQSILEISNLVGSDENSITYSAKVNKRKEVFKNVNEDGEVYVKIFTKKNHTKPDVDSAERFIIKSNHFDNLARFPHMAMKIEDLKLLQIENVVIYKKLGTSENPPKTLVEFIKSNRNEISQIFYDVMKWHGCLATSWGGDFRLQKTKIDEILFVNENWTFITTCMYEIPPKNYYRQEIMSPELLLESYEKIFKTFERFKLSKKEMEFQLENILKLSYLNNHYDKYYYKNEIMKVFEKLYPN